MQPSGFSRAHENADTATLIAGARIFGGVGPNLIDGQDVMIENGFVAQAASKIASPAGARAIDADSRVITPRFIDSKNNPV